ncbi:hypothetical protein Tco_0168481 [Tanacetum coccineum]
MTETRKSSDARPLLEDPYEAIRQAYLDGTDTESEPFEDPIDTETPESPLAIAPPIPLSESTPPVLVPILRRTARMAVRVPHAMSSGLSTGMAKVADMSESAFLEESEEEDDEEDEEIEESMDSNSVSEDVEKGSLTIIEGLTAGVEGPGMVDESYGLDDESHGRDDEIRGIDDKGHSVESGGLGLEEEEAVPRGQQQAAPVVRTTVSVPLGLGYGALRRRELASEEGDVYSTFETSGSLPISPSPSDVPSPISSPMIPLTVPSPLATPAAVKTEGFLTKLGAQVQIQGGLISDHAVRLEELSPALFKRYDRDIGELFTRSGRLGRRFSSRGQTDAQRAALWHAISDVQGENQDLRLQLAEERRALLELAEVVEGMRRGQEPKGGA